MILIDMRMPDKCENCRMIDYDGGPNCRLMSKPGAYLMLHEEDYCTRRIEACPLVEVQPKTERVWFDPLSYVDQTVWYAAEAKPALSDELKGHRASHVREQ